MAELTQGVQLQAVWTSPSEERQTGFWRVGYDCVRSIEVTMEAGQCGMVPWARVDFADGREAEVVNLAAAEGVQLAAPEAAP